VELREHIKVNQDSEDERDPFHIDCETLSGPWKKNEENCEFFSEGLGCIIKKIAITIFLDFTPAAGAAAHTL